MVHTEIIECVRDWHPISYSLGFKVIVGHSGKADYLKNILKGCIKSTKGAPLVVYDLNVSYFIILPLIICSYTPIVCLCV